MIASARQPLLLHAAVTEQFSSGISLSTQRQFSIVWVAPIYVVSCVGGARGSINSREEEAVVMTRALITLD